MATYKVLQDIEAEDKLFGPLTLKQFIFAGIALGSGYVCFVLITKGLAILTLLFLPPMLVSGFLAWPWSREQTTEIWLLAKLRFHIKPRKRIWDQSGLKDVVTVTAPVREEKNYTDGLSQGEVHSRLKALANTIDSRGWAVKNVNVNMSGPAELASNSDRLIDARNLTPQAGDAGVSAADDILDEQNNPIAQNLSRMIDATAAGRKQKIMNRLKGSTQAAAQPTAEPANYWFMNQPSAPLPAGQAVFDGSVIVAPDPAAAQAPVDQPAPATPPQIIKSGSHPTPAEPAKPSGKTPDPAILELANNDDLNVATIARQANKNKSGDFGDGEVVVPLR